MEPSDPTRSPGAKLKGLRTSLGLTIREVQERSIAIAAKEKNLEYVISHAWLTGVENENGLPSIFKFVTLASVYGRSVRELVGYYNVRIGDVGREHAEFSAPRTHLFGTAQVTDAETVTVPLRFRNEGVLDNTNLLSKLVAIWGDIPVALVERLNPQHALYGYVGLKDFTLFPQIRPGTFVQIDVNQRKVLAGPHHVMEERPIYFVELRDGYACSWCEKKPNLLLLVPHPLSPVKTRQLVYPQEAEIVGRVTAVAMRLAEMVSPSAAPGNL
ncbi:MAG: helix-turn-helix transcriptional regulator [Candidatus Acidiferrum sp.]